jgi:hypothetical protein
MRSNRTMNNIMKQRTEGKDWATARKKLIAEAVARKPNYMKDYLQPKQPSKASRRKPCKTCPK